MMKTILTFLLFIFACSLFAQGDGEIKADEIKERVRFGPCQVVPYDAVYHTVQVPNLPSLKSPGQPELPFYSCSILLPPDRGLISLEVTGTSEFLKGNCKIKPAPVPVPWFLTQDRGKLKTEGDAYRESRIFPGYLHSKPVLTKLAGYDLVTVNLYPLQYHLPAGKLEYYRTMDLTLTLRPERKTLQARKDFMERIEKRVINPKTALEYDHRDYLSSPKAQVPYVIVTSQSLLNLGIEYGFEYFANFLKSKGVNASIMTVEEIYKNYAGKDKAEQVRNFIKFAFDNWGTKYVLLGGDGDKGSEIIPVRRFKTDLHYVYLDNSTITIRESMAADYYYSALDGDFDANKNGYYGEPDDNNDLEPEVAVGRAPVDNKTQIGNFIRKTVLAYAHAEQVEAPKVLMLGEHLFSPGQCGMTKHIYGASFMNELFYGANTHGFTTSGFSGPWTMDKLYDKDKTWGSTEIKAKLNTSGACWINHIGHSSPSYNMKISRTTVSALTNPIPFLYYSQGCNAARFTNEATAPYSRSSEKETDAYDDSIAEYLVFSEKGAYAVIANWSYGLSPEEPETSNVDTPGASQYFHRFLVDAFFNPQVDLSRIGDLLLYSKKAMNPWLLDPNMQTQTVRWVHYELNLLGDPHAPIPKR